MRVGVLSDVHGNSAALAAVLARLQGRVDRYLYLGDFCGYQADVGECLALWPEPEIIGVRGNHDQVLLDLADGCGPPAGYPSGLLPVLEQTLARLSPEHLVRLRTLPVQRTVSIAGLTMAMYHGAPWDPLNARIYPDFEHWDRFAVVEADIVLLGHTHYTIEKRVGRMLILNPGSVGQPREGSDACCALLHLPSRRVDVERVSHNALASEDGTTDA